MPKLILLLSLLVWNIPSFLLSQTILKEKDVPNNIRYDFHQRFPRAESVTWIKQGEHYVGARFADEHALMIEIVYSPDEEWVQTESEITFKDLPDSVENYCRMNFGSFSLSKVRRVSTRRYGVLYDVVAIDKVKRVFLTFDMNGGLIDSKEEPIIEAENQEPVGAEPTEEKKGLSKIIRLNKKASSNSQ